NRPLLLVGVLLLGLGAGAGSAFALSKLGSTFATASQLERTFDLPAIGTISHTVTEAGQALRARQTRRFAAASGALGVLFVILLGGEFVQRGWLAGGWDDDRTQQDSRARAGKRLRWREEVAVRAGRRYVRPGRLFARTGP